MRTPNRLVAALTATTMLASNLAAVPALAQQRTEVGAASVVIGDVEFREQQDARARQLERRDRIAWGNYIASASNSQAQILLLDRSTFSIGERTRLRIDEYVYDPAEGRSGVVTVLRGALRFFSGSNEGNNTVDVNAPAGRIGIRGTAIDILAGEAAEEIGDDEPFVDNLRNVDSDEDEATLVVLRGPGAQTAGGLTLGRAEVTSGGVTVILDEPGLATYVPRAGAPPIGPFPISDAGLASIQDEIAPRVARANNGGGGGLLEALIPIAVGAVALGILLSDDGDDNVAPPNIDTGNNCDRGYYRGDNGQCIADTPNSPPIIERPPQSPTSDDVGQPPPTTAERPPAFRQTTAVNTQRQRLASAEQPPRVFAEQPRTTAERPRVLEEPRRTFAEQPPVYAEPRNTSSSDNDGYNRNVRLLNQSNETIQYLYWSSVEDSNWGADRLGNGVFPAGDQWNVTVSDGMGECYFDMRAITQSGRDIVLNRVNVCQVYDISFGPQSSNYSEQPRTFAEVPPSYADEGMGEGASIVGTYNGVGEDGLNYGFSINDDGTSFITLRGEVVDTATWYTNDAGWSCFTGMGGEGVGTYNEDGEPEVCYLFSEVGRDGRVNVTDVNGASETLIKVD